MPELSEKTKRVCDTFVTKRCMGCPIKSECQKLCNTVRPDTTVYQDRVALVNEAAERVSDTLQE